MGRVLDLADSAREGLEPDPVHDLRVALRHCRTMADVLSEVNPSPGWKKLKKASRHLFKVLGALRDTQVERQWVKRLEPANDPVRRYLLRVLARQEKLQRKDAEHALDAFDRKGWKKLARKLSEKAEFFPVESVVYQRLALGRLAEAISLFERARKSRSRIAWHRLRISLKEFRYTVENFLPQRYDTWRGDMKHMQDLLGDVHDLDVLRADIMRRKPEIDPAAAAAWLKKTEELRKARLDELRSKAGEKESIWLEWRSGFGSEHGLRNASRLPRQSAYQRNAYSAS
jgi:CHAD domain-containing protein